MAIIRFTHITLLAMGLILGACQKSRLGLTGKAQTEAPADDVLVGGPVTNSCTGNNCSAPCAETFQTQSSAGNFWEAGVVRGQASNNAYSYKKVSEVAGMPAFYLYPKATTGMLPVYRCKSSSAEFLSLDSNCGVSPNTLCCANKGSSCSASQTANSGLMGFVWPFDKTGTGLGDTQILHRCNTPADLVKAPDDALRCGTVTPIGQVPLLSTITVSDDGVSFKAFRKQLPGTVRLYRCLRNDGANDMLSTESSCENAAFTQDTTFVAYVYPYTSPMPRSARRLWRCYNPSTDKHSVAVQADGSTASTCPSGTNTENGGRAANEAWLYVPAT